MKPLLHRNNSQTKSQTIYNEGNESYTIYNEDKHGAINTEAAVSGVAAVFPGSDEPDPVRAFRLPGLSRSIYEGSGPQTWAEVHVDRIERNTRRIRERLPEGTLFMAAVKADGYGHGAVAAAWAVLKGGADALAVGLLNEAIQLRNAGIRVPILILTPIKPQEAAAAAELELSVTVFQASWLREMEAFRTWSNKQLRVHVKMDTGLGRLGIRHKQEWEAMIPLLKADHISVEGVFTHLATAQLADSTYYDKQMSRFDEMKQWVIEAGFRPQVFHASNSAAALHYPQRSLDMVRVGASLYGIDPCEPAVREQVNLHLEPTLSLHTTIVHCKEVEPGSAISYDCSYTAQDKEWIATVPLGYGDGVFRGYKGSSVLVDGQRVPIVGNVCMDQLMIRLPQYYPPGTVVTFIGRQKEEEITLEERAEQLDSIPQQVLLLLTARVRRMYTSGEPGL
ncbi:alanine racemase [Paenibacillus senegalensis]|uniref:alanine racemase n=1 Tax=Paenibacillus senegalensis TaxID=1465766 RepID=UPI00028A1F09|nr:alanine racemase [Paenibacillus senegalensis]